MGPSSGGFLAPVYLHTWTWRHWVEGKCEVTQSDRWSQQEHHRLQSYSSEQMDSHSSRQRFRVTDKSSCKWRKCAPWVAEWRWWSWGGEPRTAAHRAASTRGTSVGLIRVYWSSEKRASHPHSPTRRTAESCEKLILPMRISLKRTWFGPGSASSTVMKPARHQVKWWEEEMASTKKTGHRFIATPGDKYKWCQNS